GRLRKGGGNPARESTMHAKANILGHPIHQMLIVFPLGLLATSVAFDIAYLSTHNPRWGDIAFWMITAGVIGGLAAAVFGLIDFLAIPSGTRAKALGVLHGVGNVIVVGLFIASGVIPRPDPQPVPVSA